MSSFEISAESNDWQELLKEWGEQCLQYGERIDEYATASLPVLKDTIFDESVVMSKVYGFKEADAGTIALAMLNRTPLPGYDGPVLRVRHLTFCPRFDFSDDLTIKDYTDALVDIFAEIVILSVTKMKAQYIKIHLKSRAEIEFAQFFANALENSDSIHNVHVKGAWLYMSHKAK